MVDAVLCGGLQMSEPTPTERTDAAIVQPRTGDTELYVRANFARQLERELREAKTALEHLRDYWKSGDGLVQVIAERDKLLEALESMARQHCFTDERERFLRGVREINITDSGDIGANADALRTLAERGRFRIVRQAGRMVVGYWPENDPDTPRAQYV
jgi:hypothetical protein